MYFLMDDLWCVAASGVGAGCSRVVCMVCRLSIPSSRTDVRLTRMRASFKLFSGRLGRGRF